MKPNLEVKGFKKLCGTHDFYCSIINQGNQIIVIGDYHLAIGRYGASKYVVVIRVPSNYCLDGSHFRNCRKRSKSVDQLIDSDICGCQTRRESFSTQDIA